MSIRRKTYTVKEIKKYDLNDKVDKYIKWYYDNMVSHPNANIERDYHSIMMRNFIEKVAIWYELRFPDYQIEELMSGTAEVKEYISEVMFYNNPYMSSLFESFTSVKKIEWNKFYNAHVFINSLPSTERRLFEKPKYRNMVYIDGSRKHFHLSSDGYVTDAEYIYLYGETENFFVGKHIKEVVEFLKSNNALPNGNELEHAINDYEKRNYQREEMLNSIMYRIIERGGNRIGPKRAFLFAKEFERNIDIPLIYGIDFSDPHLSIFIAEYLKSGGTLDLNCFINYHQRETKNQKLEILQLKEIINNLEQKEKFYLLSVIEEIQRKEEQLNNGQSNKKLTLSK